MSSEAYTEPAYAPYMAPYTMFMIRLPGTQNVCFQVNRVDSTKNTCIMADELLREYRCSSAHMSRISVSVRSARCAGRRSGSVLSSAPSTSVATTNVRPSSASLNMCGANDAPASRGVL